MTDFLEAVRAVTDRTRNEIKNDIADAQAWKKAAEDDEVERLKQHYSADFLKEKMMNDAHEGWARSELLLFEDCESGSPRWWPAIADHIEQIANQLGVHFSKKEDRHLRNSSHSSLAHCSGKVSLYWGRPGQSAYGLD
jgi:hypothetical protein